MKNGRWQPGPTTAAWQWQLQGKIDTSVPGCAFEVDGFETSKSTVAELHREGVKAICYLDVGSWEEYRPDASEFPKSSLGNVYEGWEEERWLDIAHFHKFSSIMEERIAMCAHKGFDGVEPDNVAGWENETGFPLTRADQRRYNLWIARQVHRRGMAVALKNDPGQAKELVGAFDFAVVEECFQYHECGKFEPFVKAGKAVFETEYQLPPAKFCTEAKRLGFAAIRKGLELFAKPWKPCEPLPSTQASTAQRAAGVWRPKPGTTWQWQIVGRIGRLRDVQMYDVDLQDAVPSARTVRVPGIGAARWPAGENAGIIDRLHARGIVAICYLDSGAWESYRPDARLFPKSVIGSSTGWSGERWLDIRGSAWKRFAPIVWARFRLAKQIGCDGIEPDENNPIGNRPGFPISLKDEYRWYEKVAAEAHKVGLSVGMKNGVEVLDKHLAHTFDWSLNEECAFYHECGRERPFISAHKAVFQAEYTADWRRRGIDSLAGVASRVCPASLALGFSTLVKRYVPNAAFVSCAALRR